MYCSDSRTGCPVNVISDYAHKLNERLGCLWYSMIWPNGVMELSHHPGVSQLTLLKKRFQNYCLLLFYCHSVMHFLSSYMLKKGFYATHGIIANYKIPFQRSFPNWCFQILFCIKKMKPICRTTTIICISAHFHFLIFSLS